MEIWAMWRLCGGYVGYIVCFRRFLWKYGLCGVYSVF